MNLGKAKGFYFINKFKAKSICFFRFLNLGEISHICSFQYMRIVSKVIQCAVPFFYVLGENTFTKCVFGFCWIGCNLQLRVFYFFCTDYHLLSIIYNLCLSRKCISTVSKLDGGVLFLKVLTKVLCKNIIQ